MSVMRSLGVFAMLFIAAVSAACPLCASGIPHACASCGSAFVFGADTLRMHLKKKTVKAAKVDKQSKQALVSRRKRGSQPLVK